MLFRQEADGRAYLVWSEYKSHQCWFKPATPNAFSTEPAFQTHGSQGWNQSLAKEVAETDRQTDNRPVLQATHTLQMHIGFV